MTSIDWKNTFRDPEQKYRMIPFWSWNSKLESEELRRQVRLMKDAGLGGYFMHARGGLTTEYLSEDWFDCINTCIDEGEKTGMHSWAYDEEGWPSGFAGGKVAACGEFYWVKWLEYENGEVKVCSSPYYVDILSTEVVEKFVEITHEQYKEKCGLDGLKGFFTDEVQFMIHKTPWTNHMDEMFHEEYGYDLDKVLLFEDGEGYQKVRYDFWKLINRQYALYFKVQYDWCEKYGIQLTGHCMSEDDMTAQMHTSGGVMGAYEYFQLPGCDWLGRYVGGSLASKEVGSAAAQLGRLQVLSETYAMTGWTVTWQDLKWIAQWQMVNGVNLLCDHLESYSIEGARKRDYPPSLYYQNSWWGEWHHFSTWAARLGKLLAESKSKCDLLLLYPIRSCWVEFSHLDKDKKVHAMDEMFFSITENLETEFHLGDETLIERFGKVEGDRFCVGEMKYKTVLLPPMITIAKSTLDLLYQFEENGGKLQYIGMLPTLLDGEPFRIESERFQKVEVEDFQKYGETIRYSVRDYNGEEILYMVNNDKENEYVVSLDGTYTDIDMTDLSERSVSGNTVIARGGSLVLRKASDAKPEAEKAHLRIKNEWQVTACGKNSMMMDTCDFSYDGTNWEEDVNILKLFHRLVNERANQTIYQLFRFEIEEETDLSGIELVIECPEKQTIFVNGEEVKEVVGTWKDISFKRLPIGKCLQYGENKILIKRDFYQSDYVYHVLFDEDVLDTEKNKLTYDIELESIYLLGDFGVYFDDEFVEESGVLHTDGNSIIAPLRRSVKGDDLTRQGFLSFAESVTITQTVDLSEGTVLHLNSLKAPVAKVYLNGEEVKTLMFAPFEVDLAPYAQDGENELSIELFASNRNLFGPHHHADGDSTMTTPGAFLGEAGWWEVGRTDIWQDGWNYVEFGIE